MKTFQWTMQDELGLHARVAGELVKCVAAGTSRVTLEKAGKTADASRLFAVMALCVRQGEVVTVTVEGPNEDADCAALQEFCEKNF
ncbi:MAG: HPr family phosphocarrier protein [Hydrogeniiclostridium sp.]|jgi:phosphocarrier protein HPr|nr:HPr family phosphocarrier protein [Clostridiales bacterium]